MVKHLLSVLMDGITDTQMLMDYADACRETAPDVCRWFISHAEQRLEMLKRDRDDVFEKLEIGRKAKSGDEIAEALKCHIDTSIERLEKEMRG